MKKIIFLKKLLTVVVVSLMVNNLQGREAAEM